MPILGNFPSGGGGGTGGHIFPAVSIANAIKEQHPEVD